MKNKIPFFALLSANTISLAGNVLTLIALPWFVLQTTGSASKTGLTGFFSAVPLVLASFFGGALVDRIGHKRISVLADLMSGLAVAMVPLLYLTGGLEFWHLLALVFIANLMDAPGSTARTVLLPEVAELAGVRLERANAAYQSIQRLSFLIGPPLAGILIVALGPTQVLWVDAASFGVSALLIGLAAPRPRRRQGKQPQNMLGDIKEGLRYVRGDRFILSILGVVIITNFLDAPMFSVVMPVFASRTYGSAADLGLILAGFGAGAVTGAVLFGAIGHRLPRRLTFIMAFIVVGLRYWVMALLPPLAVTVGIMALAGLASGPLNPIIMTMAQERIPAELRGRVFGITTALAMIAIPLGTILSGLVIEGAGIVVTLLIMAACYLLVTVTMFFNPSFRVMEAPRQTAEEAVV